ncbi:MAG: tripartite tricarboxylate transporter substrate binding protein [Dethiobacter sp.]|jgi:tripartite-type tricarboxylate transporter receptor subunit TctC|nr:tripartite tricarboxylate transporter substrate binding protein [Dethiobacter sp.]
MSKKSYLAMLTFIIVFTLLFSMLSGCGKKTTSEVEDWPKRPIEWVLAVSAGGGTDIFARNMAKSLGEILNADIRVDNKPGESGRYVLRQPADGYTWTATHEIATTQLLQPETEFNLKTWAPIANIQDDPRWMVAFKDSSFSNAKDLIEYARTNRVTVGGVSAVGPDAVAVFFLNKHAGTKFEYIPFDSTAEVITAAMGGAIDVMTGSLISFVPQLQADQLRLMLVFSENTIAKFPDVPTARGLGYDVVMSTYRGIGVSIETPEYIKQKILDAIKEAVTTEFYQDYIRKNFLDLITDIAYLDDAEEQLARLHDMTKEFLTGIR